MSVSCVGVVECRINLMNEKIGMVGVGRMGANMARRLHECGWPVVAVHDTNAGAAEALAGELGAEACADLKRVTALAEVVFTVISDDHAMKAIFRGGLLPRARGRLFVNCATLTPAVHAWVEERAARVGAQTLEACMASSIPQARQGTLYLVCGGRREAFERAEPILRRLSASLRYIGPTGQAATVKALVNMVMNINTAALAEGLALGEALGIDLNLLREVLAQTGANSRVLETDGEDMQKREHSCYFSAAHAAKDSGIALKLARAHGLELPLATVTKRQYDRMVKLGLGDLDKSGIAELTFPGRGAERG